MQTPSRRSFLAAAGGGLIAGCLGSPGGGIASQSGIPEPLGFEAVPNNVAEPPSFQGERVYESDVARGIIDIVDRPNGWGTLLYGRSQDGYEPPKLWDHSLNGDVTAAKTLDAVPSNSVWHLEQPGDRLVVGGERKQDDRRASWFRGVDSEFAFDANWRTVYSGVTADGDSLLAAGTLQYESDSGTLGAVCHRINPDGSLTWEQTVDEAETDTQFWSVEATQSGVLAGGSNDNEMWLVSYTDVGEESWRRMLTYGEQAYDIDVITTGATGTYAVAQTNMFAQGDNHIMLLSLSAEGTVNWARVFDPNVEDYAEEPLNLYGRGIVDAGGPVLVGHTDNRVWLAATQPDGTMRWSGYYPEFGEDRIVRSFGLAVTDGRVLLYGSTGTHQEETPWLAWIEL